MAGVRFHVCDQEHRPLRPHPHLRPCRRGDRLHGHHPDHAHPVGDPRHWHPRHHHAAPVGPRDGEVLPRVVEGVDRLQPAGGCAPGVPRVRLPRQLGNVEADRH